jgi:hypothetical protein
LAPHPDERLLEVCSGVSANGVHGCRRVMWQRCVSGVYPHHPRQHSLASRQCWCTRVGPPPLSPPGRHLRDARGP